MRVMGSHTLLKEPIFFDYSTPELAFLSLSNSPLLAKYLNKNVYDKSKTKCQAFYKINPPYDFVIKKINVEKIAKKLPTFKEFVSFKSVNDKVKKAIDMAGIIGAVDFVGPEKQVRADLEKLHKS
ncbi:MAG: hypothetical protein LBB45_02165 [Methanobrevibacter sp.]|nr:hypothetical protein [Candidatus Methanovirga basalitermitum]